MSENQMDSKEIKSGFHKCSSECIAFLNGFKETTYISTILLEGDSISAHQSNGYAGWDRKFYYEGRYKDSLLVKIFIELARVPENDVNTIVWDEALKMDGGNPIEIERRKHNIFHGISLIYNFSDSVSIAINVCTGHDTNKKEFENLIFPLRSSLLSYFKEL